MAQRTIGLQIQLNGLKGVVTDIKTFEEEIKKAKQDLKELEIGSDLFNELSREIGLAETQLLSLIQSTKRLTREREIEGIGKLGQGIASSFAAAQSAVALFGTETEEVTQAAIKAQNLLTLALSARGIAEVKLGAQLVARTIAQRAATAAEAASIGVTKQLFALIAANPYTALLAVLGSLVAAYFAFGSAEEETAEKTKTLNELLLEQNETLVQQTGKIELLNEILKDTNSSLLAQEGALAALQKLVPDLTRDLEYYKNAQDEYNKAIDREIKLIELRAKQKAAEQFLVDQETKKLKERENARQAFLAGLQVEIAQERQRLYYGGLNAGQVEEAIEGYKVLRLSQAGFVEESVNLREVTKQILELEQQQRDAIEANKKATDKSKKSTKERVSAIKDLASSLKEIIRLESELLDREFKLGGFEPFITTELEKRVEKQKQLIESTNKLKTAQELLLEINGQIVGQENVVGGYYKTIQDEVLKLTTAINSFPPDITRVDKVKKQLDGFRKKILELANVEGLSDEYKKEFLKILGLVENNVNSLEKVLGVSPQFEIDKWETALTNFALKTGALLKDPLGRTQEELLNALVGAEEQYSVVRKQFIAVYLAQEREKRKETFDTLKAQSENQSLSEKERLEAAKQIKDIEDEINKSAGKVFDTLYENTVQYKNMEQAVKDVNTEVDKTNKLLSDKLGLASIGFVVENAEEVAAEFGRIFNDIGVSAEDYNALKEKLRTKDFNEDQKYAKALEQLEETLWDKLSYIDAEGNVVGVELKKLSYAEQLALLEKFLGEEFKFIEDAEDKKQKKRKETQDAWVNGLKIFADAIAQIASLEAQFTELRLQRLEQEYNKTLENIVGDSEEANKKRIDLEKEFQAEKAAIEKAATIKSLQLQFLQATADVAQAIVANLENPVVAAIAGIAGAFQLAIISQQLELARAAAGGLIVKGRAHEYGGVRAGGGLEVEGGESIINRVSTINYQGLLSSINTSGGGQALINNASNSLMEERLMQAIAKTRQEPIRAYVLGSEITNSQAINKRLDELSTL